MSASPTSTNDELENRVRRFADAVTVDVTMPETIEHLAERRRTHHTRRTGFAFLAAVAVVSFVVAVLLVHQPSTRENRSISELAVMFQRQIQYNFTPLSQAGMSLEDIANESAIVGRGRIVDARLGYTFDHGVFSDGTRDIEQNVFLVVEPTQITKGEDQLGPSGQVFISLPWSKAYDLDAYRSAAIGASDEVVFLAPVVFDSSENVTNEFAGRTQADPVYQPTHPSSLLGVDSASRTALRTADRRGDRSFAGQPGCPRGRRRRCRDVHRGAGDGRGRA